MNENIFTCDVERMLSAMVRGALRRGVASEDEAVEMRQALRLALMRAWEHYDPKRGAWKSFARRVLRSRRRELMRRYFAQRLRRVEAEARLWEDARGRPCNLWKCMPSRVLSPPEGVMLLERLEALERLPERERRVMALLAEGFRYDEIAKVTGLHERTLRRMLMHIRKKMQDY